MVNSVVLNSTSEIIDYLLDNQDNLNKIYQNFELSDDFNIKFRIIGDQWDYNEDEIDYRAGQFVYDLQKQIFTIYNKVTNQKISYKNNFEDIKPYLVRIRLAKGSTNYVVILKDAVKELISKMTEKNIKHLIIAGVICVGFYTTNVIFTNNTQKTIELKKIEQQLQNKFSKDDLKDIISLYSELSLNNQIPLRNLVNKMDNNDRLLFTYNNEDFELSKKEALTNLPKPIDESDECLKGFQVWGDFIISSQDNIKFSFKLENNAKIINKVYLNFKNPERRKLFWEKHTENLQNNQIPKLKLHISFLVDQNNEISNASILDILESNPTDMNSFEEVIKEIYNQ
jgi:hypothetical protein